MNVKNIYLISGYLSIIIGIAATMCIFRSQFLYYGVSLALAGMVFSIVNIFLNTKYFNEQEKIPKGYFGLFMSSLPVIFVMLLIYKFGK